MKRNILFLAIFSLLFCACKNTGRTLTSATGSIYEALIVVDNSLWDGEIGDAIRADMAADMPCMPQMEPTFTLSQIAPSHFDDVLKPVRNILFIDINAEKYTQTKAVYAENYYSKPQALCRVQAPTKEDLLTYWNEHGKAIADYFVRQELLRQGTFYRGYKQTAPTLAVEKRFGSEILIPEDYMLVKDSADFVWAVNNKGSLRRDIMIWSYPYTDEQTFTYDYLLHKRDSIMKAHVGGTIAGSYIGTEYKQIPPIFTPIQVQKKGYAAEVRGLWKMYGGEAMGGPFVQHTRLDELTQRVITAEVYIFAPGQKKRNPLRQAEAILYTWKLPQERNAIQEVTVQATAKDSERE